jgi:hypothetical protein
MEKPNGNVGSHMILIDVTDRQYHPKECIFDLLEGFPRAVWSHREIEAIRWAVDEAGIFDVPSLFSTEKRQKNLVEHFGADTRAFNRSHNHHYSVNSLTCILQHVEHYF